MKDRILFIAAISVFIVLVFVFGIRAIWTTVNKSADNTEDGFFTDLNEEPSLINYAFWTDNGTLFEDYLNEAGEISIDDEQYFQIKLNKYKWYGIENLLEKGTSDPLDVIAFDPLMHASNKLLNPTELDSSLYILFYNIDILEELGFDRPPEDRNTLNGMAEAAIKAGFRGIDLCLSPNDSRAAWRDLLPWFWSAGIDLEDSNGYNFNTSQSRNILRFLNDLAQKNIIAQDALYRNGETGWNDFLAGKTAFIISSLLNINNPDTRPQFNYSIMMIPGPSLTGGKAKIAKQTINAGIWPASQNHKEATHFIHFLKEGASKVSLERQTNTNNNPIQTKANDILETTDFADDFMPQNSTKNTQILSIILKEISAMLKQEQGPENTARNIQKQTYGLLTEFATQTPP
ncbi:MAG: extracellular solute-binding protein [Spirochaetaceae bacterium]|jgi:ABC-type glycerol-3-phosphate transport system substrate-binding protein|nr:extracellular solute-binding protein [Spirochaetaceae bacterium]